MNEHPIAKKQKTKNKKKTNITNQRREERRIKVMDGCRANQNPFFLPFITKKQLL